MDELETVINVSASSEITEFEIWNRKDYLNDWYDTKFRPIYENGEKVEEGRKMLQRYMPTVQAECEKILWEIFEWVLAKNRENKFLRDRNKTLKDRDKELIPRMPTIRAFFEHQRWRDTLKSRGDYPVEKYQASAEKPICSKCNKPVVVKTEKYGYCTEHYYSEVHGNNDNEIHRKDHLERIKIYVHTYREKHPGTSNKDACFNLLRKLGLLHKLPAVFQNE